MRHLVSATFLLGFLSACTGEKAPASKEAPREPVEATLAVDGGRIWYRLSGSGNGIPVILLHGGPGYGSFYLKPLEELGNDRPVVRFDQLGNGKSDRLTDTTKMNIAHFVAELDSLRAHLGYERVHIAGHSWGTILGYEYYKAHPDRVVSLALMSPALDIPEWERHANELVKTLSDSAQRFIAVATRTRKYDSKAYEAANGEFMSKYVVRNLQQADWDSTMATVGMEQYLYFQGPSEFTIVGTLKEYNVTGQLENIAVPTLFTVGQFDEANPETVRKQAALVPRSQVVVIDSAAHLTMWDNRAQTVKAVRDFLRSVDASR